MMFFVQCNSNKVAIIVILFGQERPSQTSGKSKPLPPAPVKNKTILFRINNLLLHHLLVFFPAQNPIKDVLDWGLGNPRLSASRNGTERRAKRLQRQARGSGGSKGGFSKGGFSNSCFFQCNCKTLASVFNAQIEKLPNQKPNKQINK